MMLQKTPGQRAMLDLTVLMDCSLKMAPRMQSAREMAAMMPQEVKTLASNRGWNLSQFRARVVPVSAGEDAWASPQSFSLLNEEGTGEYIRYLHDLQPAGENDAAQTMEALKAAMLQAFEPRQPGTRVRRMILLITSAAADDGQRDALNAHLAELADAWEGMDNRCRRLYLVAPREEPWSAVADWEDVMASDVLWDDAPTWEDIRETIRFSLSPISGLA